MKYGETTPKENEIIHELLAQQGITTYKIIVDAPEGSLPEGPFPNDVFAMSGYIVTKTNIYYFWLGWYDGHYTLGQEKGLWEEVTLDELSSEERDVVLKARQELQEQEKS
jgi:hypothetical protein